MASRIKVTLKQVHVKKDGRFWGKARWRLKATVGSQTVGDPDEIFVVKNGSDIALPGGWSAIETVTRKSSVKIQVHATEKARFFADDFGSMAHTMRWPFKQQMIWLENAYYRATFEVLLEAKGTFAKHDPGEVFACRQTAGNPKCTTVSGTVKKSRFEVCEVRPTPPVAYLPTRIVGMAGQVCLKSTTGITVAPGDPINVLPNPAAIPIMLKKDATDKTASRIELGFYQPQSLKLDKDDQRLEWEITTGAANAKILGSNKGMGIHVYGVAQGEVQIELKFMGAKVATYRALVRDMKKVKCRVHLLDGGAGYKTTSSASDVEDHLAVANRILRQAAIELELDSTATTTDGAKKVKDGIFRIPLPAAKKGLARNLSSNFPPATRLNRVKDVLNIYYVVSMSAGTTLGESIARPLNNSPVPKGNVFPQLSDTGTPATSWIDPSGVYPHGASTKKTIEMMNDDLDPKIPAADRKSHWSLTICNGNSTDLQHGNTLAHEICHALGLAHRESTQDLLPELHENLMHATEGPLTAQDIDIIQTKSIHNSPMVT